MRSSLVSRNRSLIGLLGILVLGGANTQTTVVAAANPYAKPIVDRNIFSLNAMSPRIIEDPPRPPPPRITLQGVTTLLGRRQVLFNVCFPPSKPGETPKEISCVLNEGQRLGEIEVLEIDDRAGSVKFNNQGTVQIMNMKDAAHQAQ